MRIAVNARLLQKDRLEGIGVFMHEILQRVVERNPQHQFHFIFNKKYHPDFIYANNVKAHVLPIPVSKMFLLEFWHNQAMPWLLKKIKAEAYLSLDNLLCGKVAIPTHLVIHDLNFEYRPQDLPKKIAQFYQKNVFHYAQNVDRIATVSNLSLQSIHDIYAYPLNQIDLVYNAPKSVFKVFEIKDKIALKKQFSEGFEYFVYVGSVHPRKNLKNLLKAYDAFAAKCDSRVNLLIVGTMMWQNKEVEEVLKTMRFKAQVVFLGRLSDADLAKVYNGALALTYIPYFEGFGIPLVEAMACACPVITSNQSALPEIVGDAGILVDPNDVVAISKAMQMLVEDALLREELVQKGLKRCADFSWDISATNYWNSVQKILPL